MKRFSESTEVNADAFLDTVANLVGILTILFVVVAAQSKSAAKAAAEQELAEEVSEEFDSRFDTAKKVRDDLDKQAQTLNRHEAEMLRRAIERQELLTQLILTKEEIEKQKEALTQEEKETLEADLKLSELQKKIAALLAQQDELETLPQQEQTITLQHLPTPMAKTVFGDEVHVMLSENQISVIPWDRLVESLKRQAEMQVTRAARTNRIVDALGPIDGFIMNYALRAEKGFVARGSSVAMAQRVELEYFVLDTTKDVIRESIDQSLSVGGRLRAELALHDSRSTTVTVWVYDDSFSTFRDLKERLFVEGYLTAARPLPKGIRVGASPNGSNSSAQ
jgi:hypothetical protein